jgi:hypothetical protein
VVTLLSVVVDVVKVLDCRDDDVDGVVRLLAREANDDESLVKLRFKNNVVEDGDNDDDDDDDNDDNNDDDNRFRMIN